MATEQYYLSVYFDDRAKRWEDRLVFHDPLFESLTTGIIALKSLRLEERYGLVFQAPKAELKAFTKKAQEMDVKNHLGLQPAPKAIEFLKQIANEAGVTVVYEQKGDSRRDQKAVAAVVANLSESIWSPYRVHKMLFELTPIMNQIMPQGLFVWPTWEIADDVPILRVLTGCGDPYTAERIGSFAFFSTQRGMEWFTKQFKGQNFKPHNNQVFVSYFCDPSMAETCVGEISLNAPLDAWCAVLISYLTKMDFQKPLHVFDGVTELKKTIDKMVNDSLLAARPKLELWDHCKVDGKNVARIKVMVPKVDIKGPVPEIYKQFKSEPVQPTEILDISKLGLPYSNSQIITQPLAAESALAHKNEIVEVEVLVASDLSRNELRFQLMI